jgi:hypothetical protein
MRRGASPRAVVPIGAAAVVATVAGVITAAVLRRSDKDTIVLAEFTNTTGDPVFDGTLRQGLAIQLQQSPFLSLVSDDRIRRTMALMNQSADAQLTPDVARAVCGRTASAAVLEGSIAALGNQYVLGLHATNCATGDILADEQAQAARKEDVLTTLSQMATSFRTRVGESLATVEKHSVPLKDVTTPSLEALQAYSAGWNTAITASPARAVPLFQRAVARSRLCDGPCVFGSATHLVSVLARQSRSRPTTEHRASDAERFYIETLYDRDFTGTWNESDERWKHGPRHLRLAEPH